VTNVISQLRVDLCGADLCRKLAAARALSEMGEGAAEAGAELVQAVADENEDVREWSVAALEEMGPPPYSALPSLTNLLKDASDVAYWAATLLGRLEAEAAPAVGELSLALQADRPLAVRQRVAWALGEIGSGARDALPALQQAAEDSDPRLARLAAQSIERIG